MANKKTAKKKDLTNLIVEVQITATSNRESEDFKAEVPTKTAYLKADEAQSAKMVEFGMTQYTSEEDNTPFFILKCARNIAVYLNGKDEEPVIRSGEIYLEDNRRNPNFKTPDDKTVKINIIKGENKGNVFCRLQAILVDDYSDIEIVVPENPFLDTK